jgi:predicted hotdog family 3-hydroxylacyl-ACP dehydratase
MPETIDTLLPHRPPMRWIDALTSVEPSKAISTTCFQADAFPVNDGSVLECAMVECMAQTVGAAAGHLARLKEGGTVPQGMLAAVSNFRIHARPAAGKLLQIQVRELKRLGPLLLVAGEISCDGQVIAEGELTLYG